ncbi:MAG TPA: GNAT family N-acetyltransferase [Bacteroidia bacterium]|nr:GNAT family N-acetyltransferase [Bacteroidia bacterium]
MAENYHYHHYAPSDLDEILALFSLSFNGLKLSPEYYKWRVLDTPVNKNLVDLFKNDNGKIISHYAVCPVKSFYNGETSLSELSLITMTHPEYKSLGLFPKLAAKLYERSFNEENIQLVYGFPNTNSHYSFVKKLAWNDVYMIPTMKKAFTTTVQGDKSYTEIFNADQRFDKLWEQHTQKTDRFYANVRNSTFINWRFFNRPDKKYRLFAFENNNTVQGYFVIKEYVNASTKEIDVVDFLFTHDFDTTAFFNSIAQLATELDAKTVNMWIPYSTPLYNLAEKSGYLPKEHITYLGYKPFNPGKKLDELRIPTNWYLTMCDSDVY